MVRVSILSFGAKNGSPAFIMATRSAKKIAIVDGRSYSAQAQSPFARVGCSSSFRNVYFFFTAFKFLRVYSPLHTPFNKPTQKPLCLIMHVLLINPLLSSRGTQRYSLVFSLFFVFENHTCAFCLESKAFAIVLNYIDITNVVITHSNLHFFQHLSF